jgi:PAS domain S-box-containing protein
MAQRCRAFDWSSTALGAPDDWPPALRSAVRVALECPFPISLWCGPLLVLIYNDAYQRVLGSKHPRALGQPGARVWHEIWPDIAPLFERIRNGGPSAYAEDARFVMERASGPAGEAWFTYSLSPVREESGEIVAFLNAASETTQRLHAEWEANEARAAAQRAEHRLREVFAQAPAFLAVLRGTDHVFEFANDAYMQLVGHREIIGRSVAEALPEVRAQGFVELLDKVFATQKPFVGRAMEVMLTRTPGAEPERVYVDFVYQPLTESTGECVGIVAHGSDVTDAVRSRRAVEALWRESERTRADVAASEERYRFLANAIPVQVWTAASDGTLDYVSDRAASVTSDP